MLNDERSFCLLYDPYNVYKKYGLFVFEPNVHVEPFIVLNPITKTQFGTFLYESLIDWMDESLLFTEYDNFDDDVSDLDILRGT